MDQHPLGQPLRLSRRNILQVRFLFLRPLQLHPLKLLRHPQRQQLADFQQNLDLLLRRGQ